MDTHRSSYDWYVRVLVATVQAFINHARHPETFGLPDLDKAENAWRTANDFNVQTADSARCQVCSRPDMLGCICDVCYEDRCA